MLVESHLFTSNRTVAKQALNVPMNHHQITGFTLASITIASLALIPFPLGAANYDEDKVPDFTLPPLLTSDSGERIRTVQQWESIRRPELLNLFASHVYGRAPAAPDSISYRVDRVEEHALAGQATAKEVTVFFSPDLDGPSMSLLIFLPNGKPHPSPAFIGLNFNGNHTVHSSPKITVPKTWVRNNQSLGITDHKATDASRGSAASRWQAEKVIERGYALVTAYYGDIDPDFDDGFQNGIHQLFHSPGNHPEADEWGSIAAWSWGLSRALDYLEHDPDVDEHRVALLGHSRLGKTALWAGASDTRFALIISNNSGCGGAALSRREYGETVARINTSFPHWFCDYFVQYNDRVGSLPIDQHMLIALAAPRPIYVASATEDQWADPKGEFLSAKLASPAYRLYGLTGINVADQPGPDHPVGEHVRYHLRTGKHDVTAYDWDQYLDFADQHLTHADR